MGKYNWEGTGYPSGKDDRTKIEKNNEKIRLNVLHAQKKKEKYIVPVFQIMTPNMKNKLLI